MKLPVLHTAADLQAALDGMVAFNRAWLRTHRAPRLYSSGVRYKREWPREEWLPIPEALRRGVADCEDLAAWRAAEVAGARAVPERQKGGGWHIVVRHRDGRREDPSRRLGMRAPGVTR